jgi:ABC-type transport system involved in cytochrome c biogenesis permease component
MFQNSGLGNAVSPLTSLTFTFELPVLLIPTLIPVLAAAVNGSTATLAGDGLPFAALQPLVVIGGIYLILCFLLFDFVLDE